MTMIQYCPQCKAKQERSPRGGCRQCGRNRSAAWRAANPVKVRLANAHWLAQRKAMQIACKELAVAEAQKITKLMKRVMAALEEEGDMTAGDVADVLDLHADHVRREGLNKLHAAGFIRVASWMPGLHGYPTRAYSLDGADDVPRPKRQTRKVKDARYRARKASVLVQAQKQANNSLVALLQVSQRRVA